MRLNRRKLLVGAGAAAAAGAAGGRLEHLAALPSDHPLFSGEAPTAGPLPPAVAPPLFAGSRVASRTLLDVIGIPTGGGATTLTTVDLGGDRVGVHASSGIVLGSLPMPAGAVLVRIDFYGWRTTPGTQDWGIFRVDPTTGDTTEAGSATAPSGTGLRQAGGPGSLPPTSATREYMFNLIATSASNAFMGVVYQYLTQETSFVPVTPFRAYDSRWASTPGPLSANQSRVIPVKDAYSLAGVLTTPNVVPDGARAVTYNLTITGTQGGGFLALTPASDAAFGASAINWSATGQDLANGGTIRTSAREIKVWAGSTGSTHFIIDVTGYYI